MAFYRKRCFKGKSCGATCINRAKRCVIELGPLVSGALDKAVNKIAEVRAGGGQPAQKRPVGRPPQGDLTKAAKGVLKQLKNEKQKGERKKAAKDLRAKAKNILSELRKGGSVKPEKPTAKSLKPAKEAKVKTGGTRSERRKAAIELRRRANEILKDLRKTEPKKSKAPSAKAPSVKAPTLKPNSVNAKVASINRKIREQQEAAKPKAATPKTPTKPSTKSDVDARAKRREIEKRLGEIDKKYAATKDAKERKDLLSQRDREISKLEKIRGGVSNTSSRMARGGVSVSDQTPSQRLTDKPLTGMGRESLRNERARLAGRDAGKEPNLIKRRQELAERIAKAAPKAEKPPTYTPTEVRREKAAKAAAAKEKLNQNITPKFIEARGFRELQKYLDNYDLNPAQRKKIEAAIAERKDAISYVRKLETKELGRYLKALQNERWQEAPAYDNARKRLDQAKKAGDPKRIEVAQAAFNYQRGQDQARWRYMREAQDEYRDRLMKQQGRKPESAPAKKSEAKPAENDRISNIKARKQIAQERSLLDKMVKAGDIKEADAEPVRDLINAKSLAQKRFDISWIKQGRNEQDARSVEFAPFNEKMRFWQRQAEINNQLQGILGKRLNDMPPNSKNEGVRMKLIERRNAAAKAQMEAQEKMRQVERDKNLAKNAAVKLAAAKKLEASDDRRKQLENLERQLISAQVRVKDARSEFNKAYVAQDQKLKAYSELQKAGAPSNELAAARKELAQAKRKLDLQYSRLGNLVRDQDDLNGKVNAVRPQLNTENLSYNTRNILQKHRDIGKELDLYTDKDLIKVNGALAADRVNFNAGQMAGAKGLGDPGAFGGFMRVPAGNMGISPSQFPDGVGIKGGKIGRNEADIVNYLGQAGIGPRLIAAKMAPDGTREHGMNVHKGFLAMGINPGQDFGRANNSPEKGGYKIAGKPVADHYWEARNAMHRLGVAHNDLHYGNLKVDDNGKVRIHDLGGAQRNWKAALAEAAGGINGKDWQAERFPVLGGLAARKGDYKSPHFIRMQEENYPKMVLYLQDKGYDLPMIKQLLNAGIRNEDEFYNKFPIKDADAKKAIEILYDGIPLG